MPSETSASYFSATTVSLGLARYAAPETPRGPDKKSPGAQASQHRRIRCRSEAIAEFRRSSPSAGRVRPRIPDLPARARPPRFPHRTLPRRRPRPAYTATGTFPRGHLRHSDQSPGLFALLRPRRPACQRHSYQRRRHGRGRAAVPGLSSWVMGQMVICQCVGGVLQIQRQKAPHDQRSCPHRLRSPAEQKSRRVQYERIGHAYPHNVGEGLTVIFYAWPLKGSEIVLLELDEGPAVAGRGKTPRAQKKGKGRQKGEKLTVAPVAATVDTWQAGARRGKLAFSASLR